MSQLAVDSSGRLKVLLADRDAGRAAVLERRLGEIADAAIVRVPAGGNLLDAVAAEAPDVIVVAMARPDRDGIDELRRLGIDDPRPIVLFVECDDRGFMEDAIAAGVSSYNVVGAGFPDVEPIVRAALALFRKHRRLEADLHKTQATLLERENIDRAKALLMRQRNLDEPQAYRWLRRKAMRESKRIAVVAAELLAAADPERSGQ